MTKQILKGLGAATVAALAMAIFCVSGQAAELRAKVPFSFNVNGATLPPGTYQVSTNDHQMVVRGATTAAMVLTNGIIANDSVEPKLVFHKYGDEYILSEAWPGGQSGRVLPKTKRERELASGEGSGRKFASFERVEVPIN